LYHFDDAANCVTLAWDKTTLTRLKTQNMINTDTIIGKFSLRSELFNINMIVYIELSKVQKAKPGVIYISPAVDPP
jgi:hypothetical protein